MAEAAMSDREMSIAQRRLVELLLVQSAFYQPFVRDLKAAFLGSRLSNCEPSKVSLVFGGDDLRTFSCKQGFERRLKQALYVLWTTRAEVLALRRRIRHHPKEPLDYLRKAQICWERRISKPLNNICAQLGIALNRKRTVGEQKELEERWNELGVDETVIDELRPVYAPRDFLESLCRLRSPNTCGAGGLDVQLDATSGVDRLGQRWKRWNLMSLPLRAKTLFALREQFPEFSSPRSAASVRSVRFGSGDDRVIVGRESHQQRRLLANRILSAAYGPVAREFAKRGCPQSERGQIWCQILGIHLTEKERLHYARLKESVIETELMIDRLMIRDVKLTASNDDQYFVFEDYLYQVMLLFSRDGEVLDHFAVSSATPLKAVTRAKNDLASDVNVVEEVYPPNGIIPFHGFTMLISPLCYLYDDPVMLYFVFRRFYTSYFFRLHTINSHAQGILCLSLLFENLVGLREPDLCKQFQGRHIQPLRVAFKWLSRCFSGYLPTDELLLLWEIVLAYDTLEIIAVLAAAIVSFRRHILRHIRSQQDAEAVLNDLSSIKVIPLIVNYLSVVDN